MANGTDVTQENLPGPAFRRAGSTGGIRVTNTTTGQTRVVPGTDQQLATSNVAQNVAQTQPQTFVGSTQLPGTIDGADFAAATNPTAAFNQSNQIAQFRQQLEGERQALDAFDREFLDSFGQTPAFDPLATQAQLREAAGLTGLFDQQRTIAEELAGIRERAFGISDRFSDLIEDLEGQGGFENIVAGRQARLSRELERRLRPFQRQEQLLLEKQANLEQNIANAKQDIAEQIQLGFQNEQLRMQREDRGFERFKFFRGEKQKSLDRIREDLDRFVEQQRQGRLDDQALVLSLLNAGLIAGGEPLTFTLSDGSRITALAPLSNDTSIKWFENDGTVIGIDENSGRVVFKEFFEGLQPDLSPEQKERADNLRKEFNGLKQVEEFNQVGSRVLLMNEAIEENRDSDNKIAIDQALINAYNKILDPSSVVRESEYARTQSDLSLVNRIRGFAEKLDAAGAGLTDNDREALASMANRYFEALSRSYNQTRGFYEGLARESGFSPEDVFAPNIFGLDNMDGSPAQQQLLPIAQNEDGSIKYQDSLSGETFDLTDDEFRQFMEATGGSNNQLSAQIDGSVVIPRSSRLAFVNNNPGNLRFVGQQGASQGEGGFARFPSPEAGYLALINDLRGKQTGQTRTGLGPQSTLRDLVFVFAPPSENASSQYANQIANALGISINTRLSEIDTNSLARAIANKESSTKLV